MTRIEIAANNEISANGSALAPLQGTRTQLTVSCWDAITVATRFIPAAKVADFAEYAIDHIGRVADGSAAGAEIVEGGRNLAVAELAMVRAQGL